MEVQCDKLMVQRIIEEGISRKLSEIIIPPGTYHCAKPICFNNVRGLTVNGEGVRIIMTDPRESGLVFNNCTGITLRGFSIDYDPLPFTQATVVLRNAAATEFEFEIHDGYRDFQLVGKHGFGCRASVFDARNMLWKMVAGINGQVSPVERRVLSTRRGHIKLARAKPALDIGDYLAFASRERDFCASGIAFKHCSTVRLEDITVLASPGMAVYCADMDGENYFRYRVARGPQNGYAVGRLLSANADGLHYHCGRRGPILDQCDFSFMDDDSVNINGPAFVIKTIENHQTLVVECNEFNAVCLSSVTKGDTIRFMNPHNYNIVAEARIEAITDIQSIAEVEEDKLRAIGDGDYAGGLFKRGRSMRISCDRHLALSGNEYCNIFNFNCPGFLVRDSHFHDHRAIGLRIFGTDGLIENTRLERIPGKAIKVGPGGCGCPGAHDGQGQDIAIRRNTISDIAGCGIAVSGANVEIKGNTITNCGASGILINVADGVRVCGNHIRGSNQMDCTSTFERTGVKSVKTEYAIDAQNVSHVEITGNRIEQSGKFCAGDIRPNACSEMVNN